MDDLDELLGGLSTWIVPRSRRVDDMLTDMVLDHLRDEAVERAATRGDLLQNRGTVGLHLHRTFNRFELSPNTSNPGQKLLFLCLGMRHGVNPILLDG